MPLFSLTLEVARIGIVRCLAEVLAHLPAQGLLVVAGGVASDDVEEAGRKQKQRNRNRVEKV